MENCGRSVIHLIFMMQSPEPFELILIGNEIYWKCKASNFTIALKKGKNWKICVKSLDDTDWVHFKKDFLSRLVILLKEKETPSQIQLSSFCEEYCSSPKL